MRIALNGMGKMGQAIAELATQHEIVATFDITNPLLAAPDPSVMNNADVVIDFSHPDVVLDHIHRYCLWGFNAVIGTTGWYQELHQVEDWVAEGQIGLLYAPNFSMGVAVISRAIKAVMPLLNELHEFDAAVHELHHTAKVDSPSGTALYLANTVLAGLDRKSHIQAEAQHQAIKGDALHVTSQRLGHIFGEHTVTFDSPFEQLKFEHIAKNRQVFASGVLKATEWLHGKEGMFSLDDYLDDILNQAG